MVFEEHRDTASSRWHDKITGYNDQSVIESGAAITSTDEGYQTVATAEGFPTAYSDAFPDCKDAVEYIVYWNQ